MDIIDEFSPPPLLSWPPRTAEQIFGPRISGFPAPIAATVAERSPAEAAEAYERAVHEVNARLAAEFAERAAAERMAERVAAGAETLRWFGDAETARIVRNWRGRYGEDVRAGRGSRRWSNANFGWLDASDAARRVVPHVPSNSERFRLEMSLGAHMLPSQSIGNDKLRDLIVAFLRADAGGGALPYAEEILSEDRFTPFHQPIRTYLKRLGAEALPGDDFDAESLDARIRRARAGRTHEREYQRRAEWARNYIP